MYTKVTTSPKRIDLWSCLACTSVQLEDDEAGWLYFDFTSHIPREQIISSETTLQILRSERSYIQMRHLGIRKPRTFKNLLREVHWCLPCLSFGYR